MLAKIDASILRLIMKIAHYIDWRWHLNNYMVACWILRFAALCVALGPVSFALRFPAYHAPNALIAVVAAGVSYMVYRSSERMRRAGEKWERGANAIPTEAYGHIMCGPVIRLAPFFVSLVMILLTARNDASIHIYWPYIILDCFVWSWNSYDGIATYFGAIPPSTRSRKTKKARAWSLGLTLQPIRGGA